MALRAVFFDAGNTLLSLNYATIVDALTREGFPVGRDEVWQAECRARVMLDPFLAQVQLRESEDVFARYMRHICEELAVAWGDGTKRALKRLQEIDRGQSLWRGSAMPGAREVLGELKARGYLLGVISNSDGRVESYLDEADLTEYLSVIVDSRIVGIEKPDPQIFTVALERTGVLPAQALYVGDLYSLDVVGARRAGLDAILLDPVGAWPALDCVKIKDLSEVPGLLPSP